MGDPGKLHTFCNSCALAIFTISTPDLPCRQLGS